MAPGGKLTSLLALLLSLKPTSGGTTLPRRRPGSRELFRPHRPRTQGPVRLLSSTLATRSSMAPQSSWLRMLPVLSDALSRPPAPAGGAGSSSASDRSCQREEDSEGQFCGLRKIINATRTKDSRVARPPHGEGSGKGGRASAAWPDWVRVSRTSPDSQAVAPDLKRTEWVFTSAVQVCVLTLWGFLEKNTKSQKILKAKH